MFCPNCGKQLADESATCSGCGETLRRAIPEGGGLFRGFLILATSFFTMPLKTQKLTARKLREIANDGKLEIGATEIPHLTWLAIAGGVLSTLLSAAAFIFFLLVGISFLLTKFKNSPAEALGGFVGYPILGFLVAVAVDWLTMGYIEILLLTSGIANDIKKIATREKEADLTVR